jgi:hypothetical protein
MVEGAGFFSRDDTGNVDIENRAGCQSIFMQKFRHEKRERTHPFFLIA